ncbi:hypothetical protein FQN51_004037 [Onygenales sp. PD_10]|nr:hypothetical protein FQN51_004037 [Onygenales sp. PD_10]
MATENSEATHLTDASGVSMSALLDRDTVPWYRKKNLRKLYCMLVPAALGVEMTSGYDGSVLNGLQAVQPWIDYFDDPSGPLLGVITGAFSIGAVLALPVVPLINDRFGRRMCIVFGSVVIAIGVVLQTASVNVGMFLASRLVLGMGIPFAIAGASLLIAELAYPKERAVITGLFNESWYVGAIIAAGATLGTFSMQSNWAWRLPSLLQFLPSFLQLSFIWFIPESPRWLLSKDRADEAFDVLATYHAEGNREDPFVLAEFEQIRETISLEVGSSKTGWSELVKTRANLHRIFIAACVGLFSQWSGNGLVSYYLAKVLASIGITSKLAQNRLNLALQCWNLITGVAGSLLTNHLTRRLQYLTSYSGMTVIFACWTAASAVYDQSTNPANGDGGANKHAANTVLAMIFLYYMLYNLMMPLTYIYISEAFPYISRSQGVSITQGFSRAGSAFNQFVNPVGLQALGWRYYIVYVAWLACETGIVYLGFPETKGLLLEEVAAVFERDAARVGKIGIGA